MSSSLHRAPICLVLASFAGCATKSGEDALTPVSAESRAAAFSLPAPELRDESPLSLWATFYTSPIVNNRAKGVPLLDRRGRPLGPRLGTADWCRAAMQGSVVVQHQDGRLVTYNFATVVDDKQVDCTPQYPRHGKIGGTRFKRAKGRYGDGALGWPLVPFRTLAVDPKHIPFGTVLYVPKARGVRIEPAGGPAFVHDGFFLAGNQGGSVDGSQVDVFIGPAKKNPFEFIKSDRRQRFVAYVVRDEVVRRGLRALHGL